MGFASARAYLRVGPVMVARQWILGLGDSGCRESLVVLPVVLWQGACVGERLVCVCVVIWSWGRVCGDQIKAGWSLGAAYFTCEFVKTALFVCFSSA